jgi:hypothetical protein
VSPLLHVELLVYVGFWVLWAAALLVLALIAFWIGNKF